MTRLTKTLPLLSAAVGMSVLSAWSTAAMEDQTGDSLHPRVKMETSLGDIVLELDAQKAPITVQNFVQYVDDKFYDGTIFHRVMKTFVIQGGGFTPDLERKTQGLRDPIKNEWDNGLKNKNGTIAMARTAAADSATSQFYINVAENFALDKPRGGAAYCVFGNVVEGMDVVDKIRSTPTTTNPKYGGGRDPVVPEEPVIIKSVRLVSAFDKSAVEKVIAAKEEAERKQQEKAMAESRKGLDEFVKKLETETGKKAQSTSSGLTYIILEEGDGASPSPEDTVEVHYTGWLVDGTKFDSSVDRGAPAKFPLNRVIRGWTEGVGMMKVGGKRKLIIPYELAYGEQGRPPSIPPKATLVFDIELLSIE